MPPPVEARFLPCHHPLDQATYRVAVFELPGRTHAIAQLAKAREFQAMLDSVQFPQAMEMVVLNLHRLQAAMWADGIPTVWV
jgi:hypothetical protein